MADARRHRGFDTAFWAVFGLYVVGAALVLGQGLLAVAASASPGLHEALHVHGLGTGLLARVARRTAEAAHMVPATLQIVLDYVFSATHLAMAAILLWLRPRDWTARLLAVALVGAAGVFNLTSQAVLEQLPPTPWEAVGQAGAHLLAGAAYVYALLLFPDGRPVPRWRPAALLPLYLLAVVPAVGLSVRVEGIARPAVLLLFFGLVVPAVGAAAQGYRIRRTEDATGQAQAQLVFWALLPSVAFGVVFVATQGLSPASTVLAGRHLPEAPVALYRSFQPAFALIPLALFAGLLRYRLWDIERLLSRTIVYAVATTLLGGAYVTFVVVVQQLLGSVAASPLIETRLAVAVTTLLLMSVFRPVRDRVQRFVDRRFHRRRYDAQVMVERFARRLRDEVEIGRIASELEAVLNDAVEPREAWLWLCDGEGGRDESNSLAVARPRPAAGDDGDVTAAGRARGGRLGRTRDVDAPV